MVKYLVEIGITFQESHRLLVLKDIAVEGQLEIAKLLLDHKLVHPNEFEYDSPLYWSCHYRQLKMIKLLVEYGADVNLGDGTDNDCGLPLDRARDEETKAFLRSHGARGEDE